MLLLIANDALLGPEWQDHPLKGDWADHRECHIGGDFLLIYQDEGNRINFVRLIKGSKLDFSMGPLPPAGTAPCFHQAAAGCKRVLTRAG
jgi:hypothetical protein